MKTTSYLPFGLVLAAMLAGNAALANNLFTPEALVGTIWASEKPYSFTVIDLEGKSRTVPSEGNYFEILGYEGKVFTGVFHWWDKATGFNVLEYATMIQTGDNTYKYNEVRHAPDSGFPGTEGWGEIRILDRDKMTLYQIGNRADGSAAAFWVTLKRVEVRPKVDMPLSYPKAK